MIGKLTFTLSLSYLAYSLGKDLGKNNKNNGNNFHFSYQDDESTITSNSVKNSGRAPNIIWLQADSMDGRLLDPTSPYWYKVEMPNLKKLAAQGMFINIKYL